jgi:hypothetical protein
LSLPSDEIAAVLESHALMIQSLAAQVDSLHGKLRFANRRLQVAEQMIVDLRRTVRSYVKG